MPDVPPRNIAMEITNALGAGDSQALAGLAIELLESAAVLRARLATYQEAEALARREEERIATEKRQRDAERKRRVRARPSESSGVHRTAADSPPLSPTPPFPTPTSSSSSSARDASRDNWQPDRETKLAAFLETDADRNALSAVLLKCDNKTSVIAEIWMILDGERSGVSRDKRHVGLALCDFAANEPRWNSVLFRSYVQRAAKPATENGRRRGGTGQRTYENAVEALKNV